jgi:hypothetical protein
MLLAIAVNPKCTGISRHIEMQDLPPVVADDEKAVQNTNVSVGTVNLDGIIRLIAKLESSLQGLPTPST